MAAVNVPPLAEVGRSYLARAIVQSVVVITVLLGLYYLLPLEPRPHGSVALRVTAGLALFVAGLANETLRVVRAKHPMLRAGVAMATVVPLFLVVFAWFYLTMSRSDPGAFSQYLSRTASLYFTVTVFSTVGFGDIVPKTDPARLVVLLQMVSDLVVLAVVVRLIFGAATRAVQARSEGAR